MANPNQSKGRQILPWIFINLINTELAEKIEKSSETDPIVLNALQAQEGEVPTQFRSRLSDWSYSHGILSYLGRTYIPNQGTLRQDILKTHHDHQTRPPENEATHLQTLLVAWNGLNQARDSTARAIP
jgi:hypothetical protein